MAGLPHRHSHLLASDSILTSSGHTRLVSQVETPAHWLSLLSARVEAADINNRDYLILASAQVGEHMAGLQVDTPVPGLHCCYRGEQMKRWSCCTDALDPEDLVEH